MLADEKSSSVFRSTAARRPFEHNLLLRPTAFALESREEESTVQEVYAALVNDATRNAQILHNIQGVVAEGRCPLVLTERIQHLTILADALNKKVKHVIVLRGGMAKKQRKAAMEQLGAVSDNELRAWNQSRGGGHSPENDLVESHS